MNKVVQWSDALHIGIPEIDCQHQGLVDTINTLWEAIVRQADNAEVSRILDELQRYVVSHFTAEEALMRVQGYPRFEEHREEHGAFQARIARARLALKAGEVPELALLHFLTEWLVKHIQVGDRDYAEFFASRRKSRSVLSRVVAVLTGSRA